MQNIGKDIGRGWVQYNFFRSPIFCIVDETLVPNIVFYLFDQSENGSEIQLRSYLDW